MNLIKSISKSSIGINSLKKLFSIISGLIFMILMTRYLGTKLRGEYAYIMNYVSILATIFNLGISLVIPNFIREKEGFTINDFISLTIVQFILNIVISFLIFLFFRNNYLIIILLLSSVSILTLQLNNITIVSNLNINAYSFILSALINIILISVAYFFLEKHLIFVILIYAAKEITMALFCIIKVKYRFIFNVKKWKTILHAGVLPMITTSLIALNYKVDIIILEFYKVDFFLIGLFATGVSLSEYSWFIPDIFKEVMLNKNSKKDEIQKTCMSLRFAFSSVLIFAIIFLFFGKLVLKMLFGEEYIDAYSITAMMFFAVPFMVYVKIIGTLFISKGKWKFYFNVILLATFINIVFNLILIPKYELMGAIYSSIFSYFICGVFFILWFKKEYSIKITELFILNKADIIRISSKIKKQTI